MRIDLHTHSDRSDGTTSPGEVVRYAHALDMDVVALTDHDTTQGWDEAADVAARVGVALVRGVELSCTLAGYGVHLLGYLPDPEYPPLIAELERILDGRNSRLPATLDKLHGLGIDIDVHDVREQAREAVAFGRPHVADALVAKGVVTSRSDAFDRYLGPQGPAYVNRYAADLFDMVATIAAAGGVSVIAHPWAGRHNYRALTEEMFGQLREAGMAGIEVDHQDHDSPKRDALRGIAGNLGLLVTGSSDYHGAGKVNHEIGCNTTDPEQFERLVELAGQSAAAAQRPAPVVVGQ